MRSDVAAGTCMPTLTRTIGFSMEDMTCVDMRQAHAHMPDIFDKEGLGFACRGRLHVRRDVQGIHTHII